MLPIFCVMPPLYRFGFSEQAKPEKFWPENWAACPPVLYFENLECPINANNFSEKIGQHFPLFWTINLEIRVTAKMLSKNLGCRISPCCEHHIDNAESLPKCLVENWAAFPPTLNAKSSESNGTKISWKKMGSIPPWQWIKILRIEWHQNVLEQNGQHFPRVLITKFTKLSHCRNAFQKTGLWKLGSISSCHALRQLGKALSLQKPKKKIGQHFPLLWTLNFHNYQMHANKAIPTQLCRISPIFNTSVEVKKKSCKNSSQKIGQRVLLFVLRKLGKSNHCKHSQKIGQHFPRFEHEV